MEVLPHYEPLNEWSMSCSTTVRRFPPLCDPAFLDPDIGGTGASATCRGWPHGPVAARHQHPPATRSRCALFEHPSRSRRAVALDRLAFGGSARAERSCAATVINCPAHRAPGRAGRPEDNPGPPGVRRRRCGGVAGNSIWAALAVPEPGRFRWLVLISPAGLGRFARAGSRRDGRRNDPTAGLGSRRLRRHSQAVRASGAPLKICSPMPLTSQRSTGAVRMGLGAAAGARYAAVEQGGPETPFPAPITKHRHVDGVVWLGEHKSLLGPPTT